MKKITFICVMALCALIAQAQTSLPPAYYADSQHVDMGKVYVNLNNIANINVVNGLDSITKTNGKVYLLFKQHYTSFLTLSDVLRSHQPDFSEQKIIYIIDNKVITDTAGIRIDPTLLLDVHAVSMSDVFYLGGGTAKMGLVSIETKPRQKDGKQQIMIRGNVAKN